MENATDISDSAIPLSMQQVTFRDKAFMLHVLTFLRYLFQCSLRAEDVPTLRP